MELAKVTTKGQVTIPIEIRRKLGINAGDKILFIEVDGKIYITASNSDMMLQTKPFLSDIKEPRPNEAAHIQGEV